MRMIMMLVAYHTRSTHAALFICHFNPHFHLFPLCKTPFALPLPCSMQDWLWGTPVTNSDGTKVLFTTGCPHSYCNCQPWYTDSGVECRFTVSQDLAQRDQQCTCNRKGLCDYIAYNVLQPLCCNRIAVMAGGAIG